MDVYPSKAAAKAAIQADRDGADGPRRVVRCVLHSGTSGAPVFHLIDAPAGRHREGGRHGAHERQLD